jgi:hypothetical protein
MGQSIVECELLTGIRSAEGIVASGHVNRTQRPNTWLLRPALRRDRSLDNPEPSTHGPWRTSAIVGRHVWSGRSGGRDL